MGFVKKSDVITTVDKLTPVSDSVGIIITKADGTTTAMTMNTDEEKIESSTGEAAVVADEITYDNAVSGLAATNVKAAIDELGTKSSSESTPLIAGEDLSVGDVVEMLSDGSVIKCLTSADSDKETFNSGLVTYSSVAKLSATKFIVCYRNSGSTDYGTACILDIVDGVITVGTPTVFESAATSYISVVSLSETQALVCYLDAGNSNYGTSIILNVSGTTITPATPVVFESATTTYISATKLSASQVLVAYLDGGNTNYGTACILNVSGSVITPATPVVFESASTTYISVTTLSSTKALVCYSDGGNSNYGTACILNVSGSTITPATPTVFRSSSASLNTVITLNSSKALVAYVDVVNASLGTAIVLSISGTTITPATNTVFENNGTSYPSLSAISSTKAVVSYSATSLGQSCVLNISGSTLSVGTKTTFESASSSYISSIPISVNRALICYGAASLGKAYTLPIAGSFFGVSASNCLATETCNVKTEGKAYVSGTFSLGDSVYLSSNGQASTTGTGERLGVAVDNSNNVLLRLGNPRANLATGVTSFTSGSGTWTVPAGVYNIDICVVGGGGGATLNSNLYQGGNGGDTVFLSVRVSPGNIISYSVGVAGTTANWPSPTSGGNSTCLLTGVFSITATGGNKGEQANYFTTGNPLNSTGGIIVRGGLGNGDLGQSSDNICKGGSSTRGSGAQTYTNKVATGYGSGGCSGSGSGSPFHATAGLVEFRYTKGKV